MIVNDLLTLLESDRYFNPEAPHWALTQKIEVFIKFVDSTGGYVLSYKSPGFDECKQEVLEGDSLGES